MRMIIRSMAIQMISIIKNPAIRRQEFLDYPDEQQEYLRHRKARRMDDAVTTDKGISIGSTKDAVTKAYGDAAEESAPKLTYKDGDPKMTIGLNIDSVSSLEISAVEEE